MHTFYSYACNQHQFSSWIYIFSLHIKYVSHEMLNIIILIKIHMPDDYICMSEERFYLPSRDTILKTPFANSPLMSYCLPPPPILYLGITHFKPILWELTFLKFMLNNGLYDSMYHELYPYVLAITGLSAMARLWKANLMRFLLPQGKEIHQYVICSQSVIFRNWHCKRVISKKYLRSF